MRRDRTAICAIALAIVTLLYVLWQIGRWAGTPEPKKRSEPTSTLMEAMQIVPVVVETTTTQAPTTTTTAASVPTTLPRASRGTPRSEHTDGFWLALAQCESERGRTSPNIFQFSSDTARKVGIDGSESYEVQRAAAITWAARVHPNEGTDSGWPHCWWVALSSQG